MTQEDSSPDQGALFRRPTQNEVKRALGLLVEPADGETGESDAAATDVRLDSPAESDRSAAETKARKQELVAEIAHLEQRLRDTREINELWTHLVEPHKRELTEAVGETQAMVDQLRGLLRAWGTRLRANDQVFVEIEYAQTEEVQLEGHEGEALRSWATNLKSESEELMSKLQQQEAIGPLTRLSQRIFEGGDQYRDRIARLRRPGVDQHAGVTEPSDESVDELKERADQLRAELESASSDTERQQRLTLLDEIEAFDRIGRRQGAWLEEGSQKFGRNVEMVTEVLDRSNFYRTGQGNRRSILQDYYDVIAPLYSNATQDLEADLEAFRRVLDQMTGVIG